MSTDMGAPPTSWKDQKKYVEVLGRKMAYVERGSGDPIVCLHGNPTSSYLYRNIIPELEHRGRCLVPDLIGMGDSEKLPLEPENYTLANHQKFVDGFLEAVGATSNLTFVVQDWGSSLAFDWARRHPGAVRNLAYFEAITRPLDNWDDWVGSPESRQIFQDLRTPGKGEEMVLKNNFFIEEIFTGAILKDMSDEDMNEYRRYYKTDEERLPMLVWPRQIPVDGEPADVAKIINDYADYLATAPGIRKLHIKLDPGFVLSSNGPMLEVARSWPDQTEISLPGIHFGQEDSGPEIGKAIADWME